MKLAVPCHSTQRATVVFQTALANGEAIHLVLYSSPVQLNFTNDGDN